MWERTRSSHSVEKYKYKFILKRIWRRYKSWRKNKDVFPVELCELKEHIFTITSSLCFLKTCFSAAWLIFFLECVKRSKERKGEKWGKALWMKKVQAAFWETDRGQDEEKMEQKDILWAGLALWFYSISPAEAIYQICHPAIVSDYKEASSVLVPKQQRSQSSKLPLNSILIL